MYLLNVIIHLAIVWNMTMQYEYYQYENQTDEHKIIKDMNQFEFALKPWIRWTAYKLVHHLQFCTGVTQLPSTRNKLKAFMYVC